MQPKNCYRMTPGIQRYSKLTNLFIYFIRMIFSIVLLYVKILFLYFYSIFHIIYKITNH